MKEPIMSGSIRINKELWAKVKKCAEKAGYHSPEEFVETLVEKELARIAPVREVEQIHRRPRGLAPIDR
jgi:predicted phage gp36 major capsid-like protein